jgi:dTMP kinase
MASEEDARALRRWIFDTEYGDFNLPRPDLNLFLDVPIGFVEANLASQRQGDDRGYLSGGRDIHEADIAFQKRVREIYLEQASLDKDFLVVDCTAPDGSMLGPYEIFSRIRAIVDEYLNKLP